MSVVERKTQIEYLKKQFLPEKPKPKEFLNPYFFVSTSYYP